MQVQIRKARVSPLGLAALLGIPTWPRGLIVFAHDSGADRLSTTHLFVAGALWDVGLATLLFDLLTPQEAADRENVLDMALLARRLDAAADWARQDVRHLAQLPLGYFGTRTGAAVALVAGASRQSRVAAIVCCCGRTELAVGELAWVKAPTLLIAGSEDHPALEIGQMALEQLLCPKRLAVVPGAALELEQRDDLTRVAELASDWFVRHLAHGTGGSANMEGVFLARWP